MSSLLVVNSHFFPGYIIIIIVRWQSLAMGTQERGDAAVVNVREGGEAVAVIHSGRARGREVRWRQSFTVGGHRERGVGERSGREERGVAVDGGETWGGMNQNNHQPVR